MGFEETGHVDPFLHPEGRGAGEGVDEEHEEDSGVDSYVPVSDGADGVDVGAVVGADGGVARGWGGVSEIVFYGKLKGRGNHVGRW